jgi:hypothetical protein
MTAKCEQVNEATQGIIRCIEHQKDIQGSVTPDELIKFSTEAGFLLEQHKNIFTAFEE